MKRARSAVPRPKAPGEYHHGDLRRALLDAAMQIVAESGAEGFNLREAARRVGVDHRAAYRHFEDREAVLAAVAEEGYRALIEEVRRRLAEVRPEDTRGRLLTIARTYVEFAVRQPARYGVMTGPRVNERGRFAALEAPLEEAFGLLRSEIETGVASGALSRVDPVEATIAVWTAMHGLASLIGVRRFRVRRDRVGELAERAIGHMVRGLEVGER